MTSDGPSQIIEFTELDFIRLVGNLGTRLEGSFEPVRGRGFHALVEACNVIDDRLAFRRSAFGPSLVVWRLCCAGIR